MSKEWWKAAGIRAIKTVAQTAVATIGVSATMTDVDWSPYKLVDTGSIYFQVSYHY